MGPFRKQTELLVTFTLVILGSLFIHFGAAAAESGQTANYLKNKLPFTFTYGGRSFDQLVTSWTMNEEPTMSLANGVTQITRRYTDPHGMLQVDYQVTQYPQPFLATETVLILKNIGKSPTSVISKVRPGRLQFSSEGADEFRLDYAAGALKSENKARSDFTPLAKIVAPGESFELKPKEGHSSDTTMPFFNLETSHSTGYILAVGWSGQWVTHWSRSRNPSGDLSFEAGQENFSVQLLPQEQVRTPAVLVMPWHGQDSMAGQNQFRQLMLKYFSPTRNGAPVAPIVAASVTGVVADYTVLSEKEALASLPNLEASGIPFNTLWVDAGWYTDSKNEWTHGLGDWSPNPTRFPEGFKNMAAGAHQRNMDFLVWFEPERVSIGSQAFHDIPLQSPSWFLHNTQFPKGLFSNPKIFTAWDYSNPQVIDMMVAKISDRIRKSGIDVFRNDMNIGSLYEYWISRDAKLTRHTFLARNGMTEAKYIMGLYAFWDRLRAIFPHLLIDNCASGGRRLDFEMMRRSVVLWRSDRAGEVTEDQNHEIGLAYWVPLQAGGGGMTDTDLNFLRYRIRSNFSWSMVFGAMWTDPLNTPIWSVMKAEIPGWRKSAELFLGDYYPWVSNEGGAKYDPALNPDYLYRKDIWVGWQFNRTDLGKGIVQIFRREKVASPSVKQTILLKGLNPQSMYEVVDFDQPGQMNHRSGDSLMKEGITASCAGTPCAYFAKVFTYQALGE